MTNRQLLSKLKKEDFYKDLLDNDDVEIICIYVTGSHIYDLSNSNSDIDIAIVTRNQVCDHGILMRTVDEDGENIKIDVFFNTLDDYSKIDDDIRLSKAIGQFELNFITNDTILYRGKNIDELLSLKDNNLHNGVDIGIYNMCKCLKQDLDVIVTNDVCGFSFVRVQRLYHICVAYHYLSHTDVNIEMIQRMKDQPQIFDTIDEDLQQYIRNCVVYVTNFINNN